MARNKKPQGEGDANQDEENGETPDAAAEGAPKTKKSWKDKFKKNPKATNLEDVASE